MRGPQVPAALLALALALVALPVRGGIFGGGPTIDGDSYKYDGKGKTFVPKDAFDTDDKFNTISLTNWDMSTVNDLTIPRSVQTLILNNCKLSTTPTEINALENLQSLNLASNAITTVDTGFGAGTKLTALNLTKNTIESFNALIPTLQALDLTNNALKGVPPSVFKTPTLTSLYLTGNLFKIDSVSVAEFDFYAGLSDFSADFVQVSACANTSDLVNLKGARVCRLRDIQQTSAPVIIIQTVTPTPTVSAVSPAATVSPGAATNGSATNATAGGAASPASVADARDANGDSKTFIAYGVVFVLVAIGLVGGLYSYITRRHTDRLRGALHEETPLFFDSDKRTNYYHQELATGDKLFPSNDPVLVTWRLDYDSIKLTKRIAKGAFGEVWVGRYRGAKVAVKKLLEEHGGSYEASEDFIREIKLMAWLKHPKIVAFVGVAWTRLVDMMAVNEFMDSGDLRSYLELHTRSELLMAWSSAASPKLQFALDTIDAIVYLHSLSPVIIHRDLKSRNILIDSKKGAKIADFGISAAKREQDMTVGVGTTRWLAPELATGATQYTEAVDVYAFGVILAELDTHELPFFDATTPSGEKLGDLAILQGVASGRLSVSFSANCPENLQFLAERCLAHDPLQRPKAAEVAYELRRKDILLGGSTRSSQGPGGGFV